MTICEREYPVTGTLMNPITKQDIYIVNIPMMAERPIPAGKPDKRLLSHTKRKCIDAKAVSSYLLNIGIAPSRKGYELLKTAIMLALEDHRFLSNLTGRLYPELCRRFKCSAAAADHNIREAISVGWERGDIDLQIATFGYSIDHDTGLPTVTEFIAAAREYLLLQAEPPELHEDAEQAIYAKMYDVLAAMERGDEWRATLAPIKKG